MGEPDEPENYHEVRYQLREDDGTTTLTLTQDGNDSQEQADTFGDTWKQMLQVLKASVEPD